MASIGIEIEVLLSLTREYLGEISGSSGLEEFSEWIVEYFNSNTNGNFHMHSDIDGEYDGLHESSEWSLTDDATLSLTKTSNQWAVEIVSPILRYGDGSWSEELEELWNCLEISCYAETNRSCGTHVHISPRVGVRWDLDELKQICRAIIYFEKAFEVLVPPGRRSNEYAKSNRYDNPILANMTDNGSINEIDSCTTDVAIADLMNNGGDRYYGWNFTNLYHGRKMTIEFRRTTGVQDFGTCQSWVEVAVSFVQAARASDDFAVLEGFAPDVKGLHDFITLLSGQTTEQIEAIDSIFDGKSGSIVPTPVGHLSSAKRERFEKKKEKDDKKNFMVEKWRSAS